MIKTVPPRYDIAKLKPVFSVEQFDLHYNKIYTKHVEDFNNSKGDFAYNKAGAFLHELYFENIRERRENNVPTGKVEQIINMRYGSLDNFVSTVIEQSERLQGNGWIWMNTAGYVNIIPNHRIVDNVALVIDLWEHAFLANFGTDRESYLKQHFSIINWEIVNQRILAPKEK